MIVTDRFVFLHLHKSGGSFVNECILRFIPEARSIGYHLPRLLTPVASAHLPILGFVRSPWSYYVSWYNFQSQRPQPNPLFRALSEDRRLDFDGTVRNMLRLDSDSDLLERVISGLPATYGNHGLNLPKFALAPIRGSGLGFYSFLYRYMYGEHGRNLTVERAEQLRPKLLAFLERIGHRVTNALHDFVMDGSARNTSVHGPYADYYSAELRELVAEKDKLILGRHEYRFGEPN